MNPVRIGIIGIGNIGSTHARNLLTGKVPNAQLTGICDINPAALNPFPEVKAWGHSAELIRSGEVDAVIVAAPHFDHTTIGIDVLQQGLHLLVEKPLSAHKADAERLLAAHTNPKQVFGIMFDTRTEPRYIKLREMVQGGELGRIRRINWILTTWFRSDFYYRSSNWRATWAGEGGGMLINQLPHDLDLFQWIFGLPKRVRAFCPIGKYHDVEVEDEVNSIFEYENGTTAMLMATTGEAPGSDRREIIGDNGRILVQQDHLQFTRNNIPSDEFCRTTPGSFSKPDSTEIRIPCEGTAGRHVEVIQRFVDSILTGTPLVAQAGEGVASLELANAIIMSSETDRTIELPLNASDYEQFLRAKMKHSRYTGLPSGSVVITEDMSASFQ